MDDQRPNPDELLQPTPAAVGGSVDAYRQPKLHRLRLPRRTSSWRAYALALAVVLICTLLASLVYPLFAPANLVMIYLLGVVIAASQYGRGPSVLASLLSVAAFDFFFVHPHLTFAVADTQYIFTFVTMLLVGLTISTLTVEIKQQAEQALERERRTASLYALSRDLANTRDPDALVGLAAQHIGGVFNSRVTILQTAGGLQPAAVNAELIDTQEAAVARWVYEHQRLAGRHTDTLSTARGLYLPLTASQGVVGVLAVFPNDPRRFIPVDQLHLLETFANQTALALERTRLADDAARAQIEVEAERTRNTLLSSVSHDLRTPLAVITGATSSLLQRKEALTETDRRELAQVAFEESERLNRFVGNLLDMTRLESGAIHVTKEWQLLEEVIGAALNRIHSRTARQAIHVSIPADFPLVQFDESLIEQVLNNLLENALKYSPPNTPIDISAQAGADEITVEVADRGPGLQPGDEERIFDKFYRTQPSLTKGVGLGLAICRGIIQAHGGRIWAENRPGGGAVFRFTLPVSGDAPTVEEEYEL